jgi:DNA-binding MarR family transcriptional regulator
MVADDNRLAGPMPETTYHLESSLGYLINRASRAIRKVFNARLEAGNYPVTGEQWAVLVHLWERDGRPQFELADVLGKDKTTMTRFIDGLEKRNLVVRIADQQDRRQNRVYLTPLGKSLEAPTKAVALDVLNTATADVSGEDMAACKRALDRIYETLMEN